MTVEILTHYLAAFEQGIAARGWAIQAVGASATLPDRCYTVGLTARQHPELVVIGCDCRNSVRWLDLACQRVQDGQRFRDWSLLREGHITLVLRELSAVPLRSIAPVAVRLFDANRMLQVFLPDPNGHYPWQPACQFKFKRQMCLAYASSSEGIAII